MSISCPICQKQLGSTGGCDTSGCPGAKVYQFETIAPPSKDEANLFVTEGLQEPKTDGSSSLPIGPISLEIPGYERFRPIGKGGMGLVYEAIQRSLNRKVAIKILAPHLAGNSMFVSRFEREAKALARLNHSNIVNIFDFGKQGQILFFVMEFVESTGGDKPRDLQQVLASGPLPFPKAIHLAIQVTKALDAAHNQGIIHRDIKPSNIMLDAQGNAKVTDFGIASLDGGDMGFGITGPSSSMGTFGYMAPEQARNAAGADGRSDIFSVGVLIYELLTGELPLGSYTPASQIRPEIPLEMDRVIARATQNKPENRFQTIGELTETLEALIFTNPKVAGVYPTPKSTCQNCQAQNQNDAQFCGTCGLNVRWNCPNCNQEITADVRFCPKCRTEVQLFRKREGHRERGRQMLAKANGKGPPHERGEWAADAAMEFGLAVQAIPGDDSDSQLKEKATRLGVALLAEAGQNAANQKKYHQAAHFYLKILELDPSSQPAQRALAKLNDLKAKNEKEIEDSLAQGNLKKLEVLLGTLETCFSGDKSFETYLFRAKSRLSLCKEALSQRIPDLIRLNDQYSILQTIEGLKSEGIQLPQLEHLKKNAEIRIQKAEILLQSARDHKARGNLHSAQKMIQQAATLTIGGKDANQLAEELEKGRENQQTIQSQIEEAIEKTRWFRAALLQTAYPTLAKPDWVTKTGIGLSQANLGQTLVAVVFLGSFLWLVTSFPAKLMYQGLTPYLPSDLLNQTSYLTETQCVLGIGAILFGFGLGKRQIRFLPTFLGILLVGGICVIHGVLESQLSHWESWNRSSYYKNGLDIFKSALISASMSGCLVVGTRFLLIPKDQSISWFMPILLGTLAAILVSFSGYLFQSPLRILPLGLTLCGAMAAIQLSPGFKRYPLFIIGAILAGLVRSGGELGFGNKDQSGFLWSLWILIGAGVLSLSRFQVTTLFQGVSLCLGISVLWEWIQPTGPLNWILPSWFLFWGTVCSEISEEADFRLHAWDRFCWVWRVFCQKQKTIRFEELLKNQGKSKISKVFKNPQELDLHHPLLYALVPPAIFTGLSIMLLVGMLFWTPYESNWLFFIGFVGVFLVTLIFSGFLIGFSDFDFPKKLIGAWLLNGIAGWIIICLSLFHVFGNQAICYYLGPKDWEFFVSENEGFEILKPNNFKKQSQDGKEFKRYSCDVSQDYETKRSPIECLSHLKDRIVNRDVLKGSSIHESYFNGFHSLTIKNSVKSITVKLVAVPRYSKTQFSLQYYQLFALESEGKGTDDNDHWFFQSFQVRKLSRN